jgi:hypothetical protein
MERPELESGIGERVQVSGAGPGVLRFYGLHKVRPSSGSLVASQQCRRVGGVSVHRIFFLFVFDLVISLFSDCTAQLIAQVQYIHVSHAELRSFGSLSSVVWTFVSTGLKEKIFFHYC